MTSTDWLPAPVGIDSPRWVTRADCRNVLVVVHTLVSCHRLLDVVEYVETDPRIQVVFTIAPDALGYGVSDVLHRLGGVVLPWRQAIRERFDLAVTAAYGGLHEVHAPLLVMPHGAGHGKRFATSGSGSPSLVEPTVYGLDSQRLVRDGRVLPAALVLSHDSQLPVLERQCPEAVPVAVVAGDPCFDRLAASLSMRERYREALGVAADQELVVVSSTWGKAALFGRCRDLLPELMTQLPATSFRVVALLHPGVWSAHGRRQVRAWLRDCREAGLVLVEPDTDWRAAVIAADHVLGDHGSVTAYAAAIGRRILCLPTSGPRSVSPGSAQELVARSATRLDPGRPLLEQIRGAKPVDGKAVAALLTSQPGRADLLLRRAMYRLLRLSVPGSHRRAVPAPAPDVREVAD